MANLDLYSPGFMATADLPRWFSSVASGWTIDPTGGSRSGSGAYALKAAASTSYIQRVPMEPVGDETIVLGWREMIDGDPFSQVVLAAFAYLGWFHLGIRRGTDGVLSLINHQGNSENATLLASDVAPVTGAFHFYKWATTIGSSGTSKLWVNGVLALDYAGDTRGRYATFGIPPIESLWTSYAFSASTPDAVFYIQDVYVNDGVGDDTDDWGDIQVNPGRPISDGTYEEFTPSAGTDSFALVDDVTPDDDTTRLDSPATGSRSTFNMGAMEATGDTIKSTALVWLAEKTDANPCLLAPMLYRAAASTPTVVGNDTGPSLNSYVYEGQVFARDPHEGNIVWTEANLEATEEGIKETT
jgi:hypothetical protein